MSVQQNVSPPYGRRVSGLRAGAVFLAFLAGAAVGDGARAQTAGGPSTADVARLSAARTAAERAHLWRVGAWGVANVAAGAALLAASSRAGHPGRHAFGLQSAAWGAVNVSIAAVALSRGARGAADSLVALGPALGAENALGDVLWLNMGLNAGYVAVGVTLWAVASRGVSNPAAWRGHGQAVVLQGAALLALDGLVLAGSRARLGALTEMVALVPTGSGLALVVGL